MIVLYDQDISSHFPPHYKTVYENIVCERDGRIFCYSASTLDGELPPFYDCIINFRNVITARLRIAGHFIAHAFRNRKRLAGETILAHDDVVLALSALVVTRIWGGRFVYRISQIKPEVRQQMSRGVVHLMAKLLAHARNAIMRKADAVILMSEEMRSYFNTLGVAQNNTVVIPSCIDMRLYGPSLAVEGKSFTELKESLSKFSLVLVYVGNINSARGTAILPSVVAQLNAKRDTAILLIGARQQKQQYDLLADRFLAEGVADRLFATDLVAEEYLPQFIRLGHVGLSIFPPMTVFRVNSPLKVLNYLAAGVPFAGTDTRDQRYAAEHSGFGIVSELDTESLIGAIESAIALPREKHRQATQWLNKERNLPFAKEKIRELIFSLEQPRD